MIILSEKPPVNELALLGNEMRLYALSDPCLIPADCFDPRFYRRIGEDYSVSVTLEMFRQPGLLPPPRWHASLCMLHEVASGSDQVFGMPEQAVMATFQWDGSKIKLAREMLGEILGPVIVGEKQVVREHLDKMAIHWLTEFRADG